MSSSRSKLRYDRKPVRETNTSDYASIGPLVTTALAKSHKLVIARRKKQRHHKGQRETVEEFLARGGKVTVIEAHDVPIPEFGGRRPGEKRRGIR